MVPSRVTQRRMRLAILILTLLIVFTTGWSIFHRPATPMEHASPAPKASTLPHS